MELTSDLTRCPLCGHSYQAEARSHCQGCPLANGCETVCCPACGFVDVDPRRSTLGRWLGMRRRRREGESGRRARPAPESGPALTLREVPPGYRARIASVDDAPIARRRQLRAYGLLVGDWIHIVQQLPVTVAIVERTELALESALAERILVDSVERAA